MKYRPRCCRGHFSPELAKLALALWRENAGIHLLTSTSLRGTSARAWLMSNKSCRESSIENEAAAGYRPSGDRRRQWPRG